MTEAQEQRKENVEASSVEEQKPTQSPEPFKDSETAQTLAEPVVSPATKENLVSEEGTVWNSKDEADQQASTVAVAASTQENVVTEECTVENSKDEVDQQESTVPVSAITQENVVTEEVTEQISHEEADQEVSAVVAQVPVQAEISEEVKVGVPFEKKLPSLEIIHEIPDQKQPTKSAAEAEAEQEKVVEEIAVLEKPVKEKPVLSDKNQQENDTALPSEPVESKSLATPAEKRVLSTDTQEKKDIPLQSEPVETKTLATPAENHAAPAATVKAAEKPVVIAQSTALPVIVKRTAEEHETPLPPQECVKAPITPKKTVDDPTKTSVTLPASSLPKDSELTEEYWKENMPEGHTYDKISKIFYAFDHDLNGTVVMCELADALRCCGLYVSQKEVYKLRVQLGLEHDRVLNFCQFCKFLAIRKKDSIERLTKAFKRFDRDNSGFIDTKELRRCLTSMGEALTMRQVDDMLSGLDVNSDGKVDFQEFVDYMTSPSR